MCARVVEVSLDSPPPPIHKFPGCRIYESISNSSFPWRESRELGGMKLKSIIKENRSMPSPAQDPVTGMLLVLSSSPQADGRLCLSKSKWKVYWS